jgi:thiol-disulfide isomerase/thioredoxin
MHLNFFKILNFSWCGHCRKLEPIMDQVANSLDDNLGVTIAKVDATMHHKAATHFDIKAYPTIK